MSVQTTLFMIRCVSTSGGQADNTGYQHGPATTTESWDPSVSYGTARGGHGSRAPPSVEQVFRSLLAPGRLRTERVQFEGCRRAGRDGNTDSAQGHGESWPARAPCRTKQIDPKTARAGSRCSQHPHGGVPARPSASTAAVPDHERGLSRLAGWLVGRLT